MDSNSFKYDETYYKSHCGNDYERNNGWEEIFAVYASHIVKELAPKTSLDVGCASGYMVESLRDRGVDAEGADISDYALSCVREDIKPYCFKHSATEPFEKKYDLVTCIEVLEHLSRNDISLAVENLCNTSDVVLFSSTPFDYDEESHISVHPVEFWAELFAYNGFYHDVQYDCSYLSVQAMLFRKNKKNEIDLIRDYERLLFQKHQENVAVRHKLVLSNENVELYKSAYQKHVDIINNELNPKIIKLSEVESGYRKSYADEVEKRKFFEDRYYINTEEHKELEIYKVENEQLKHTLECMRNDFGKDVRRYVVSTSLKGFLVSKYRWKKENKILLAKDESFWKPVFNAEYYAEHNPDIRDVYGADAYKLLKHFICFGMLEGRVANSSFDINVYMACNPDVVEEWKGDVRAYYLHYITDGRKEGRRAI